MKTLLITIFLILFSTSNRTETFFGQVVGISDGDTITVLLTEKKQVKVRLDGIDCPEKKQDFGEKSKQFTSSLCFGKVVKVVWSKKDRYGRILGFVYVDDVCVNEELLKNGLAWHYKEYNKDKTLSKMETKAKKKKIGIWSQPYPIPPWEFRKISKDKKS